MIEKTLEITTNDGEMETFICHPERNGPSPAVFFLMDAHGVLITGLPCPGRPCATGNVLPTAGLSIPKLAAARQSTWRVERWIKTIAERPQGMTSGEITKELGGQGISQQSIANALSSLMQSKKIGSGGRGGKYRSVTDEVPTAPARPSS